MALGKLDDAAASYREAIEIDPNAPAYHLHLANVLDQQGNVREAVSELQESLRLWPTNCDAMARLAWILATNPDASVRKGKEAKEVAETAVRFTGRQFPEALNSLAAAYAETGQFDKAVDTADEAMKLARQRNNQALAGRSTN